VPQYLSEHVDRGDDNICTTALGYFGTLISSGIVATARVGSHITGHGHGGSDGENQHWIDHIGGSPSKGRPGMRLDMIRSRIS
jgi:hypothetical protein